ncbi:hypothetical protein HK100_004757 [Physocladia obscura]|uniref:NADH:ubiquinone oxidoreductase intermediate-associated protein 30 domain-containing protein n=1 Tax=Physocladia obscura TaxID=109957 RepID=A0AAD5TAL6_9FUNG|nr:hypothetical protein HK100_004757 [Physocladia obscura]
MNGMGWTWTTALLVGFMVVAVQCAVVAEKQKAMLHPDSALFGRNTHDGWRTERDWAIVTDAVRGGSSTAKVVISPRDKTLYFSGNLDTTTLGGAGFASARFNFDAPLNLTGVRALLITVASRDDKTYALNLVDSLPETSPDGRKQSAIEYKFSFGPESSFSEKNAEIYAPISGFVPYYRGRRVENAPPLNTSNIVAISIMIQSYFDQQKGDYSLKLSSIDARK